MAESSKNSKEYENSLVPTGETTPKVNVETEESLVAPLPREEDLDWIIATYRKHALKRVSEELDTLLGGRGSTHYISPSLLDKNPVQFRQSLQEQVFPTPREVREDLIEIPSGRVMLQARAGMGKTTFVKSYQEKLLEGDPSQQWFPIPIYFPLL